MENLDKKNNLELLEKMFLIRLAEEKVSELLQKGKIKTPCHLYIGQEAIASGVCYNLQRNDYLFSNHRAHGHYLAKNGDLNAMMAEILCKKDGCSGGRGGSMHLCDPRVGILGTSSILGGSVGIALGAAMASKIKKDGKVAVVFHGDTVVEEGIWSETANFSALYKLPLIYVCENNFYSAHMPLLERRVSDNFIEIAKAHGLNTYSCDGNDILEVVKVSHTAIENARAGRGAQFIECKTYRWLGHLGANDDIDKGIRSLKELLYWKERCPIKLFTKYLLAAEILSEQEVLDVRDKVQTKVDYAAEFAINSPYPSADTLKEHIYYQESQEVICQ